VSEQRVVYPAQEVRAVYPAQVAIDLPTIINFMLVIMVVAMMMGVIGKVMERVPA